MLNHVQPFVTLQTEAHQGPLPWNFPDKNTGVGCHFLFQGNLPNPGIEPTSPALQMNSLLDVLYSTGSHIQFLIITYNRKESEYMYISLNITESLYTQNQHTKLTVLQLKNGKK